MQGKQEESHDLFIYKTVDDFVPQSHMLRKIEAVLKLNFVRELTQSFYSDNNGRPSIDPEVFFRMMLIKYMYGIESERRLCDDIQYNLAYRWYCRLSLNDPVPDHSSLTRIRDRFGEAIFEMFFDHVVKVCKKHGLVKGDRIMTDSTLIEANASLESLVAIDPELREEESKSFQESRKNNTNPKRKIANKTHRSTTDHDSTLAFKRGTPRSLKYKGHFSIDADSSIILDAHITTGAEHESHCFLDRLDTIKQKYNIGVNHAIADRAYGGGAVLMQLSNLGIRTTIPLFFGPSGTSIPEGFKFDKQQNVVICPLGHHLNPYVNKKPNPIRRYYRMYGNTCLTCSYEAQCPGRIRDHKRKARRVEVSQFYETFKLVKEKMKLDSFKKTMIERFWKIEGVIGESKNVHKLKRAQFRSRKKVQIQAYFTASVQNIKRLVKSLDDFDHVLDAVMDHMMMVMNSLSSLIRYLSPFKSYLKILVRF